MVLAVSIPPETTVYTCMVMGTVRNVIMPSEKKALKPRSLMFGSFVSYIINPRRACAARVTVVGLCVCLSVCLCVDDYSRTTGYEAAYERYQQLQCYKGMKINVAILLKRLRSRDME